MSTTSLAGAVLDVWPDTQAVALQQRVRTAIRATRGDGALLHDGGRLHMSLGYSYAAANSDPLKERAERERAAEAA
ncbi:hypothetical protein ABZS86_35880 [Streptomyces sp. NPDC005355]|uniref:hypothetical protein n=1 Tax=Streptomyces sp. NPDC005355 TaxID=3157038 RepID=UPI0033B6151C